MCTSFACCLTNYKGGFNFVELHSRLSCPVTQDGNGTRRLRVVQDDQDGDSVVVTTVTSPRRQRSVMARSLDDLRGCSCKHIPKHGTTADGLPGTHRHRHAAVSARPSPAIRQVVSTDDRSGPHHALGQAGCGSLRASLHQPSGSSCHGARASSPLSSMGRGSTESLPGNSFYPNGRRQPHRSPSEHITRLLFPELLICTHLQHLPRPSQLIDMWG